MTDISPEKAGLARLVDALERNMTRRKEPVPTGEFMLLLACHIEVMDINRKMLDYLYKSDGSLSLSNEEFQELFFDFSEATNRSMRLLSTSLQRIQGE